MRSQSLKIRDIAVHEPVTAHANESIGICARRMHDEHVGCLVVVEPNDGSEFPVGMLTDRDIAIRVAAEDKKASRVHAREIMSHESVTCRDTDEVEQAEAVMAEHHKSRLMVVDDDGRLVGVLSLADLLTAAADLRALETLQRIAEREARAAIH